MSHSYDTTVDKSNHLDTAGGGEVTVWALVKIRLGGFGLTPPWFVRRMFCLSAVGPREQF